MKNKIVEFWKQMAPIRWNGPQTCPFKCSLLLQGQAAVPKRYNFKPVFFLCVWSMYWSGIVIFNRDTVMKYANFSMSVLQLVTHLQCLGPPAGQTQAEHKTILVTMVLQNYDWVLIFAWDPSVQVQTALSWQSLIILNIINEHPLKSKWVLIYMIKYVELDLTHH